MELTWLDEPTVDALRAALRTVAPDLAEATIVPRGLEPNDNPQYCTASAAVDGRFVVKFAWAGPAPSGQSMRKLQEMPAFGRPDLGVRSRQPCT